MVKVHFLQVGIKLIHYSLLKTISSLTYILLLFFSNAIFFLIQPTLLLLLFYSIHLYLDLATCFPISLLFILSYISDFPFRVILFYWRTSFRTSFNEGLLVANSLSLVWNVFLFHPWKIFLLSYKFQAGRYTFNTLKLPFHFGCHCWYWQGRL